MTRKSSSCFSNLSSGSSLLRMTPASSMKPWAFSRLFQKFSSAISEFNSPERFCKVATSKKPPQVREFPGRGRQLGGDHFKHAGRIQEPEAGIQKGFNHGWTRMDTDTGLNGGTATHERRRHAPPTESRGDLWRDRCAEPLVEIHFESCAERCR